LFGLQTNPNKRVFILTRSGFAGQQGYAGATWSGDVAASWENYRKQIIAGLSYSLSGFPYWCADIGAYFIKYPEAEKNDLYLELYTRWFQFGTFSPIFRIHGEGIPREPWRFSGKYFDTQAKYIALRYQLMPYIYSNAYEVYLHGSTIMRPLNMDFENMDLDSDYKYQFMFGKSLMICPITVAGVTETEVLLPKENNWFDFETNEYFEGGKSYKVKADLTKIPIYAKSGSIVPMEMNKQFANDRKDSLYISVFEGKDGVFTLYDDEGDNYNYEKGMYSKIEFAYKDSDKSLTISERQGKFENNQTITMLIKFISKDKIIEKNVQYKGKFVMCK